MMMIGFGELWVEIHTRCEPGCLSHISPGDSKRPSRPLSSRVHWIVQFSTAYLFKVCTAQDCILTSHISPADSKRPSRPPESTESCSSVQFTLQSITLTIQCICESYISPRDPPVLYLVESTGELNPIDQYSLPFYKVELSSAFLHLTSSLQEVEETLPSFTGLHCTAESCSQCSVLLPEECHIVYL